MDIFHKIKFNKSKSSLYLKRRISGFFKFDSPFILVRSKQSVIIFVGHGNKLLLRRHPQFCVNRTKTETVTTSFCHLADSNADHAYEDDPSETKTVKLMLPNIDQL